MADTAFKTKINKQLSPIQKTGLHCRLSDWLPEGTEMDLSCLVGIVLFVPTLNNKSLGHIKILTTDHVCYDTQWGKKNKEIT